MTPREWNHVLDHKVEWSIAYPAVAREVKYRLAVHPYPGLTTNNLVEVLYPYDDAKGDGHFARRRIFTALDALREHELADWCHQEEPTRARFGKMIRRVRWHQPQAVTEAEEVQTPEPSPASKLVMELRAIMACEPGCEGRCDRCPESVARDAADYIEKLEHLIQA